MSKQQTTCPTKFNDCVITRVIVDKKFNDTQVRHYTIDIERLRKAIKKHIKIHHSLDVDVTLVYSEVAASNNPILIAERIVKKEFSLTEIKRVQLKRTEGSLPLAISMMIGLLNDRLITDRKQLMKFIELDNCAYIYYKKAHHNYMNFDVNYRNIYQSILVEFDIELEKLK